MLDVGNVVYFCFSFMLLSESPFRQLEALSTPFERAALLELRSSLGLRSKEWPIKADHCLIWQGIKCNNGRVIEINISGFKRTRIGRQNPQFAVNALANLTLLQSFNASSFLLRDSIPDWFGLKLRSLRLLDLRSCSVIGAIPSSLGDLKNLTGLYLSDNNLTGTIPSSFGQLKHVSVLDLSSNYLTGSITSDIGSLLKLEYLNVSHNMFYGNLMSAFRRFPVLDMSMNYFEGTGLDYVLTTNSSLESNCLQNVLKQRSLSECSLFYAERGLAFDNFGSVTSRKRNMDAITLTSSLGGFGLIFFLVLLVLLILCRQKRATKKIKGRGSLNFLNLGDAFTYKQLLQATNGFDNANIIKRGHSGDLFRGVLENGTNVIIKRVDLRLTKQESYLLELGFFSKVSSHERLVPILGHCLGNEKEKFMVYKYMANEDLASCLYRKSIPDNKNLRCLDWITRLKIALGTAEGLAFLHHDCSPPLVHRDVQGSGILLDEKFEVRLGSLSKVCPQKGYSHQDRIARLLRLQQSSDYGSSDSPTAECSYDIYCFGKVLLELVTGKLGISSSCNSKGKEWLVQTLPYISVYDKELVTNIVDPSLIMDEDFLEEVWATAVIAKSCLNPRPSRRPAIRYVLKALENPLKIVREEKENASSSRLGTTSRDIFPEAYDVEI